MSISTLDTLRALELFDKNDKMVNLDKIDNLILKKKFEYLRTDRLEKVLNEISEKIPSNKDISFLASSLSTKNYINKVATYSLVSNRVYIDDPIVLASREMNENSKAANSAFGMMGESDDDFNISEIKSALKYYEKMAPLIRCGTLSIIPINQIHAPKNETPIYFSEDRFKSEVPEKIYDFVHNSALIGELVPLGKNKGFNVINKYPENPTRGITVDFLNDNPYNGRAFYLLTKSEVDGNQNDKSVKVRQFLDWDSPPSDEEFKAWIVQSINRTIIQRLEKVKNELMLSDYTKSSYMTESEFEANICGMPAKNNLGIKAVNFLNAISGILTLDDPYLLAGFKNDKSRLIERWQQSLLALVSGISEIDEDFDQKSKILFEKEVMPLIDEINKALIKFRYGFGGSILTSAGSVGLAFCNRNNLPFAAALACGAFNAVGNSMQSWGDYKSKLMGPAFIWNKLVRK